ncbi:glycosyltransferase [Novosphingobium lentum]|uniref:glycosyltransferase n=1 Tax=Novosphingobium lentum TaxID=145287 RepID=UPI0008357399|nr:glycosyltransferase [Novosphingobium lentum]
MIALAIGLAALAVWTGLLATGFWRCSERDDTARCITPLHWPDVVAVVPARDEADVIARSLGSLAAQDYPGAFRVILIDDNSSDGTAAVADSIGSRRIEVRQGAPLANGWTGKLWALSQGIAAAGTPTYVWLTDADIEHAPDTLRRLVGIAEAVGPDGRGRSLVSFMAKLHCRTMAERALVPAFVFFFMMLYPFNRVNRPGRTAGAAGGCVLVRSDALEAAGGIAAMRGALIDDCTLGALIKRQGPVWLGLTDRSRSIRPYHSAGEIAAMIARSAYAQLRYSPVLLAGTLAGLALLYISPVALALGGEGPARIAGALVWLAMALAYQPMLRFYHRSPLWGVALPAIGWFYAGCTVWSAVQHHRGRGGMWKGRAQAQLAGGGQ